MPMRLWKRKILGKCWRPSSARPVQGSEGEAGDTGRGRQRISRLLNLSIEYCEIALNRLRISGAVTENAPGDCGSDMDALSFEGVSHAYGELLAVDDISLSVGQGEVVCLLGPSGCGKTTALRIAAGLEDLQRGRVLLEGKEVAGKGTQPAAGAALASASSSRTSPSFPISPSRTMSPSA